MKIIKVLIVISVCFSFSFLGKSNQIKGGIWYSHLELTPNNHLPFIVEIKKDKKQNSFSIYNGSERIILKDIQFKDDSVVIRFPAFASEIRAAIINKKTLKGRWYNYAKKGNYFIPFESVYELKTKYPIEKSNFEVDGRWEVTFSYQTKSPYKAIGLFETVPKKSFTGEMISNRVTGTFLTETGDYRFLEGATIKDSLFLSTFDGSHAFLFKSHFKEDTLWGEFLSGNHYSDHWYAVRNDSFELRDPDSLTYLTSNKPITFSLPSIDGSTFRFPQDSEKGKVTLIQITGTWCPNCLDESIFLREIIKEYQADLQIIAVTFETQKTMEGKISKVSSYKEKLNLPYTFLIGGDACKSCATELFPSLSEILSFPTLVFIDKKGEVRKIHTGFNGPGTGDYYEQFRATTKHFIDLLIAEKV